MSAYAPGAYAPGAYAPGAYAPGAYAPGAYAHGAHGGAQGALGPSPDDLEELDARVARGAAVTRDALDLAIAIEDGSATVAQAQAFLAEDYEDAAPYADLKPLVAALMRVDRARYCGRLYSEDGGAVVPSAQVR